METIIKNRLNDYFEYIYILDAHNFTAAPELIQPAPTFAEWLRGINTNPGLAMVA